MKNFEIAALLLERDMAREAAQQLRVQCENLQVRVIELEKALAAAREESSRWAEARAFIA